MGFTIQTSISSYRPLYRPLWFTIQTYRLCSIKGSKFVILKLLHSLYVCMVNPNGLYPFSDCVQSLQKYVPRNRVSEGPCLRTPLCSGVRNRWTSLNRYFRIGGCYRVVGTGESFGICCYSIQLNDGCVHILGFKNVEASPSHAKKNGCM